jgi:preprotein translocase subunit SecE
MDQKQLSKPAATPAPKPTPTPAAKPAAAASAKPEAASAPSPLDNVWITLSIAVLLGAMWGFYYFEGQYDTALRVLGLLGAIGVAGGLLYLSHTGKTMLAYVIGSRVELRKVVWPSRQESVQTTLMIAVVVLIMSLVLWGLDSALLWGVKALTGRG